MRNVLTAEQARALLSYNPETGAFFWKIKRGHMKAGSPAGHIQIFRRRSGIELAAKYLVIRVNNSLYLAHRLAWLLITGEFPKDKLDHKDADSLNNRFNNLREATQAQNARNTRVRSDNKSAFKGVSWDQINSKWVARIRVYRGRYRNLGRFNDPAEAHEAYMSAAREIAGEFARAA